MFFKASVFKRNMKDSVKRAGLIVGMNDSGNYVIYDSGLRWAVETVKDLVPNKILAAIIEVVGSIPRVPGEYTRYFTDESGMNSYSVSSDIDVRTDWELAVTAANNTGYIVTDGLSEYALYKRPAAADPIMIEVDFCRNLLTLKELIPDVEKKPSLCSDENNVYWKTETTIYMAKYHRASKDRLDDYTIRMRREGI